MTKPDLTPGEVKAILQADKTAREEQARKRIEQVLTEERCTMFPMIVLTAGNVTGRIEVKALE